MGSYLLNISAIIIVGLAGYYIQDMACLDDKPSVSI